MGRAQFQRFEIMKEIVAIAREQFWTIGVSLPAESYAIVKNNFHNVPDNRWEAFRYSTPGGLCKGRANRDLGREGRPPGPSPGSTFTPSEAPNLMASTAAAHL